MRRLGAKESGQSSPASARPKAETSSPVSSRQVPETLLYEVYVRLAGGRFKGKWVTVGDLAQGGDEAAFKGSLLRLKYLHLVGMKGRKYKAADLSPPQVKAVESLLKSLTTQSSLKELYETKRLLAQQCLPILSPIDKNASSPVELSWFMVEVVERRERRRGVNVFLPLRKEARKDGIGRRYTRKEILYSGYIFVQATAETLPEIHSANFVRAIRKVESLNEQSIISAIDPASSPVGNGDNAKGIYGRRWYVSIFQRLIRMSEVEEGDKVIDVGTGYGLGANLLSRNIGPQSVVIGIDSSQEMIEKAKILNGKHKNVEIVNGNAMYKRFGVLERTEKVKGVFAFNIIHLLKNKAQFLENVRNVLTDDGEFCFTTSYFRNSQSDAFSGFIRRSYGRVLRIFKEEYPQYKNNSSSMGERSRQLSAKEYIRLIESLDFEIKDYSIKTIYVPGKSIEWIALSEMFLDKILPGIDRKIGEEVFARAINEELEKTSQRVFERKWLFVKSVKKEKSARPLSDISGGSSPIEEKLLVKKDKSKENWNLGQIRIRKNFINKLIERLQETGVEINKFDKQIIHKALRFDRNRKREGAKLDMYVLMGLLSREDEKTILSLETGGRKSKKEVSEKAGTFDIKRFYEELLIQVEGLSDDSMTNKELGQVLRFDGIYGFKKKHVKILDLVIKGKTTEEICKADKCTPEHLGYIFKEHIYPFFKVSFFIFRISAILLQALL